MHLSALPEMPIKKKKSFYFQKWINPRQGESQLLLGKENNKEIRPS